ncbi:hypothetical protein RND81_03G194300 [Saponaria officinalis]|uniref:Pentatricopeptide repeat-containing protein n=1 Tax=Saponaria officinalis TaxID=3572 RepID=A0AAW1M1E2_SAPOF
MILQTTLSHSTTQFISPQISSSSPHGSSSFALSFPYKKTHNLNHSIRCSISQVHNYGTIDDHGKRHLLKWSNIFKRISTIDDPEIGVSSELNRCENDGKKFTKWELCRIAKELRKYKRYKLALEVYEWMNNRIGTFRLSSSDTAIQLDLIAKVRGITYAEDYFTRVPDTVKDKRIYGALLNAYVGAKIRDKAETLMEKIRNKGYAIDPLPYNVMMTLYMKLEEFDKVEELISEMKQKKIPLDSYSYNIWISARGSRGSAEVMEQVLEEMESDPSIVTNWTTFSTMAAMYVKLRLPEKAEQCLRILETRIVGRDRMPYHYLISLYGSVGNKDEVYRVWNIYKSIFTNVPNWGYHSVISSLVRLGDIEGAEKLYEEWLPVKFTYDPKIGNLLMGWYVKEASFEKVKGFFDHMIEVGGKPSAASWEILGEGHIKEGRISEALTCFKEAFRAEGTKNWRPKPSNVTAFFELCDKEADQASKDDLVALLTQMGCMEDEKYSSLPNENEETESKDPGMLISVIE